MNKKKLFGMIIGVTLFGILIAGATFAWLTFGVTVGENVLTANTLNFIVQFDGGADVTNLPILDSNYIEAKDAGVVTVVLKKNPASPNGHASIWLNTTSDTKMTKDSVVRWVVCRDPNVETTGEQIDNVCGNKVLMENDQPKYETTNPYSGPLNHGIITGSGPIPLLSDALLADSDGLARGANAVSGCKTTNGVSMCPVSLTNKDMLMSSGVSYFVYMWLEAEPIVNQHLDEQYYKTGTTTQYKIDGGGTPDYDSVTSISRYAFEDASLTSVVIPDSVISIGGYAFCGTSITNVVIPKSVISIGDYAFGYMYSLTDVYYEGTEAEWNAIVINDDGNGNDSLLNAIIHYNYTGK